MAELIEVPLFGPTTETERNEACVKATEDLNAVILNSSGFQGAATVCIVEAKETIFISTQGQPQDFMDPRVKAAREPRQHQLRGSNSLLPVPRLGRTHSDSILGVASPDTPGQPETVEESLIAPLEAAGVEVVYDVIRCNGSTICEGVVDSVTNMRNAGITHFFNVMGILTAPGYVDEMVNQGFNPATCNSSPRTSTASPANWSPARSPTTRRPALYNGAIINDFRTTGEYRNDGYQPSPWQNLCVGLYNDNNAIGANHQWEDQGGDSAFGMAISICSILRVMARAIYDAGDNPTRDDITAALNNLGPLDLSGMSPASILLARVRCPTPSRPWTSVTRAISGTRTFATTAKRSASPDVKTGPSRLATDPVVVTHGDDDAARATRAWPPRTFLEVHGQARARAPPHRPPGQSAGPAADLDDRGAGAGTAEQRAEG